MSSLRCLLCFTVAFSFLTVAARADDETAKAETAKVEKKTDDSAKADAKKKTDAKAKAKKKGDAKKQVDARAKKRADAKKKADARAKKRADAKKKAAADNKKKKAKVVNDKPGPKPNALSELRARLLPTLLKSKTPTTTIPRTV